MRDEIATTMRLLGVTRLDQLGPHLVSSIFLSSLGQEYERLISSAQYESARSIIERQFQLRSGVEIMHFVRLSQTNRRPTMCLTEQSVTARAISDLSRRVLILLTVRPASPTIILMQQFSHRRRL